MSGRAPVAGPPSRPRQGHIVKRSQRLTTGLLALAIMASAPLCAEAKVRVRHGTVVAAEPDAADAGLKVLKAGGSAVDAAVVRKVSESRTDWAIGHALARCGWLTTVYGDDGREIGGIIIGQCTRRRTLLTP